MYVHQWLLTGSFACGWVQQDTKQTTTVVQCIKSYVHLYSFAESMRAADPTSRVGFLHISPDLDSAELLH